jgi:hypothetical protein
MPIRDLVRSHGVLLVYNPVSPTSFQHVTGFYEQIIRSKWRSLPVVLFSNTPAHLGVTEAREFREFHPRSLVIYLQLIRALRFQMVTILPKRMPSRSSKLLLVALCQHLF